MKVDGHKVWWDITFQALPSKTVVRSRQLFLLGSLLPEARRLGHTSLVPRVNKFQQGGRWGGGGEILECLPLTLFSCCTSTSYKISL